MASEGLVYIVDDDLDLADSLARLVRREGWEARPFSNPAALIREYRGEIPVCVIADVMLGEVDGFSVAKELRSLDPACAMIFMTAWPSTAGAVDAIRLHAGVDYLEKPPDVPRLLRSLGEALAWSARRRAAERRLHGLTARERQVLELVAQGKSTKVIAQELNLSPKTIEDHRAAIRQKTGASTLQQLLELLR